jgi:hypothetical protein
VAEYIADRYGIKAEPITVPLAGDVDTLFVGGGVYKWTLDTKLKAFLNTLDPEAIKTVVAFTTAGGMDKTGMIAEICTSRGIRVSEERLGLKVLLRNHKALGGKDGKFVLTSKDKRYIDEFLNRL